MTGPGIRARCEERFEFLSQLGEGAFGEVWRVRDRSTGAECALKLLVDVDPGRFDRELQASLRVHHPALIRCFEGDRVGSEGFLLLELAEGTLEREIGNPSFRSAGWDFLVGAVEGTAALHAAGVVHRDLKPANLLRIGDQVKVSDLGLAKLQDLPTMTKTGIIQGTPGFIAPEVVLGEALTPAADVFALGALFYLLLEAELPYAAGTPMERLLQVSRGEIQPYRLAHQLLPIETVELLQRCLAFRSAERPIDLLALAASLGAVGPKSAAAGGGPTRVRTPDGNVPATKLGQAGFEEPSAAVWSQPQSSNRQLGSALFLILGALAVFGGFLRVTPGRPVPAIDKSHVLEDLAVRVDYRLDELGSYGYDRGGNLVHRRSVPDTDRFEPFPERDPLRWDLVMKAIPALDEWEKWLYAGGDPLKLPRELVKALKLVDRRFLNLGLARPFFPYLYIKPALKRTVSPDIWTMPRRSRKHLVGVLAIDLPDAADGWMGTVFEKMTAEGRLLAAHDAAERKAINTGDRGDIPEHLFVELRVTARTSGFDDRPTRAMLRSLRHALQDPFRRNSAYAHYREVLENRSALAYALARSAREQAEYGDLAASLAHWLAATYQDANLAPQRLQGRDFPVLAPPPNGAATGVHLAEFWRNNQSRGARREVKLAAGHRVDLPLEALEIGAGGPFEASRVTSAWTLFGAVRVDLGEDGPHWDEYEMRKGSLLELPARHFWTVHRALADRAKDKDSARAQSAVRALGLARSARYGPEAIVRQQLIRDWARSAR